MSSRTAIIKQVDGLSLAGRTDSNHWIVMDGPADFGGSDAGIRPKELLLLALGGCAASDVIAILRKKRAAVDRVEVRVTADQSDDHPQVFTRMHLEFIVRGDGVRPEDVARAIELSETKYCPVHAMLRQAITLSSSYRIEQHAAA